jgi:flagellar basal-body rod protein FlgG
LNIGKSIRREAAMKAGWTTLTCGVVLGGALGFVGGQVAAWTRDTDRASTANTPWNADVVAPVPSADVTAGAPADIADDQTVYFPEATPAQAVRAEGFSGVGDSHGGDSSGTASEPATLPGANDAQPINVREDQERHNLRRLIDAEMGAISDQDREVWEDVLRGLPAEDALGILRMWQRFGQGAAGHKPRLPAVSSPSGLPPLVPRDNAATFVPGSRTVPTPHGGASSDPVRADLLRARAILVNNLLNADSPGFRRTEPVFADLSPGDSESADAGQAPARGRITIPIGVQLSGQRLDLTEGTFQFTGGPFDLAIEGDGFFIVGETDQRYYTRCGRFRINSARRLVLMTAEKEFVLEPEIVVPANASGVFVDSNGNVSATPAANQPVPLGRITLARFLDPTALIPAGRCLLSAGPSAGPMRRAAAGDDAGIIRQGHLESSNVDRDRERERVRQLDERLQLLAETPH